MKSCRKIICFVVITITHLVCVGNATAGIASTALREVAELLFEKGGREIAKDSAESVARKLGTVAEKYGPAGVDAARRGGPTAFRYLVEGGEQAPKVVKLFEKYGDSAIQVVSRPKSMAIFIKHGEEAATAMIRHPGIAEDLIAPLGAPASRALSANPSSSKGRGVTARADSACDCSSRVTIPL